MSERTWSFTSVSHVVGEQVIFAWRWLAVNGDGAACRSNALFPTLDACVRDAEENGFSGKVDAANGAFTPDGYAISVSPAAKSARSAPSR